MLSFQGRDFKGLFFDFRSQLRTLFIDIAEYFKTWQWYLHKKLHFLGTGFEESKGILVDVLMAKRGAYHRPFLHFALTALAIVAIFFAPFIVSQYPTARGVGIVGEQSPSTVVKSPFDTGSMELSTIESQKPRRDVLDHVVASGETLSTLAKNYNVDVESIKTLNNFDDGHLLHPGDKIKIPPVSGVIITVKSGDTVYSLAKKYGLASAQPIADWPYNTFVDDEKFSLASGQTLVIPGGVAPSEIPIPAPILQKTPENQIFARGSGILSWPTNGVITQYFAFYHNGVDIASNSAPSINAADSGRVVSVLYLNYGYGFHVIIDHGNGYRTLYGHMSRIDVSVGQNVSRGDHLGIMGSTGRSTGPHLHFTVYQNGTAVNPLSLLK